MIEDIRPDGIYSFTYNAAGRLASVSKDGILQAEYVYNWLGQQVVRRLFSGGVLSQTIHAVHDHLGHRIAEYDAGAASLLREYCWLGAMPVAVVEGGQVYYVRTDHIGRPAFATEVIAGQVYEAWRAEYLPFGGVDVTTGTTPVALRSRSKRSTGAFRFTAHSGPVVPGRKRAPSELAPGL